MKKFYKLRDKSYMSFNRTNRGGSFNNNGNNTVNNRNNNSTTNYNNNIGFRPAL